MHKQKQVTFTKELIEQIAADGMCCPQLDPRKDFEPELTYAQRLAKYINYVTSEDRTDAEDPSIIIIY